MSPELTPAILNEFISKILVHERDVKKSKYAVHRIEVYLNHIGRFENELTAQLEPTEQECERMRAEIEEAKREKSRAYHRAYYKEYRKKNLERCREYERMKAREYRAKKKLQAATENRMTKTTKRGFLSTGNLFFRSAKEDFNDRKNRNADR